MLRKINRLIAVCAAFAVAVVVIYTNQQLSKDPVFAQTPPISSFTVTYDPSGKSEPYFIAYNYGKISYPWLSLKDMGDGWTNKKRADELRDRLETFLTEGMIDTVSGKVPDSKGGYIKVIYIRTKKKPSDWQLLLTVPNDKNPSDIMPLLRCKLSNPASITKACPAVIDA
jgi:hypothetical protein